MKPKVMALRLYLDTCCFNRPYDDQLQLKIRLETEAKVYVQQKILDGVYDLAWSYVMDYENGLNPFSERRNRISLWKDIAKLFCSEEEIILIEAEKLQSLGVKVLDSLHVACAAFIGCDYFLTTDMRLFKKPITLIQVIDPVEFIRRECLP
jgi:predicted nucleic acid-binding protein